MFVIQHRSGQNIAKFDFCEAIFRGVVVVKPPVTGEKIHGGRGWHGIGRAGIIVILDIGQLRCGVCLT